MRNIKIAPSILSADFGSLNDEIASVEKYADLLHVDVMDGHFVPNITIGAPVLRNLKTKLPLDCHLMIENPELYIENFVKAGASGITVHQEVCPRLPQIIQQIKSYKTSGINGGKAGLPVKAAVAINPSTPVKIPKSVLQKLDMILIMSVNPGFGGQKFIDAILKKIIALHKIAPQLDIQVDGGINAKTAKMCVKAGANILVAGSYIFGSKNRKKAIESLYLAARAPAA